MQLLDSHLMVWLSQELRPKVQVSYWYSLNTCHCTVLSKQGYAKVDVHLPRRVILVVDCIVQEVRGRSYCTVIRQIQDVVVQDEIQRLYEWIEIKKWCSPNDSLHMVGIKVVWKCNITPSSSSTTLVDACTHWWEHPSYPCCPSWVIPRSQLLKGVKWYLHGQAVASTPQCQLAPFLSEGKRVCYLHTSTAAAWPWDLRCLSTPPCCRFLQRVHGPP